MKILSILFTVRFYIVYSKYLTFQDYRHHHCRRTCNSFESPKICHYQLTIEHMLSNEPSCLNCVNGNYDDCFKPDCIIADGANRLINVYNKKMPGPTIEVCQGDQIVVEFKNNLLDVSSTIHWHGLHQRNTQYMDGVPFISQCPILPQTTFQYHFNASQVGTHWYHSHSSVQRTNGAFGALIIRKPKSKFDKLYDFDMSEHIIMLNDWFDDSPDTHLYKQVRNKIISLNIISAILVNGFGSTANNSIPPRRFIVEQGFRYRFRIIHAGAEVCPLKLNIDRHQFYVISADGNDMEPILTDSISMVNGERYDIVVAANQRLDTYAIRISGYMFCNFSTVAALIYKRSKSVTVSYKYARLDPDVIGVTNHNLPRNTPNVYDYCQLRSVMEFPNDLIGNPDFKYFVGFDVTFYNGSGLRIPHFNKIVMDVPPTPLLLNPNPHNTCNAENNRACARGINICECVHIVELPYNGLVEIILVDEGTSVDLVHPIHLHGYNFYVIGQDKIGQKTTTEYVKQLDGDGKLYRNYDRPIIKDTIAVTDGGYLIIRFRADNPGFWLMHCHIDFHSEEGMMMVFKSGDLNIPLPRNFPKCGNFP